MKRQIIAGIVSLCLISIIGPPVTATEPIDPFILFQGTVCNNGNPVGSGFGMTVVNLDAERTFEFTTNGNGYFEHNVGPGASLGDMLEVTPDNSFGEVYINMIPITVTCISTQEIIYLIDVSENPDPQGDKINTGLHKSDDYKFTVNPIAYSAMGYTRDTSAGGKDFSIRAFTVSSITNIQYWEEDDSKPLSSAEYIAHDYWRITLDQMGIALPETVVKTWTWDWNTDSNLRYIRSSFYKFDTHHWDPAVYIEFDDQDFDQLYFLDDYGYRVKVTVEWRCVCWTVASTQPGGGPPNPPAFDTEWGENVWSDKLWVNPS